MRPDLLVPNTRHAGIAVYRVASTNLVTLYRSKSLRGSAGRLTAGERPARAEIPAGTVAGSSIGKEGRVRTGRGPGAGDQERSGHLVVAADPAAVPPARAGMDLSQSRRSVTFTGLPRASGDGPVAEVLEGSKGRIAPNSRGSTIVGARRETLRGDDPGTCGDEAPEDR